MNEHIIHIRFQAISIRLLVWNIRITRVSLQISSRAKGCFRHCANQIKGKILSSNIASVFKEEKASNFKTSQQAHKAWFRSKVNLHIRIFISRIIPTIITKPKTRLPIQSKASWITLLRIMAVWSKKEFQLSIPQVRLLITVVLPEATSQLKIPVCNRKVPYIM